MDDSCSQAGALIVRYSVALKVGQAWFGLWIAAQQQGGIANLLNHFSTGLLEQFCDNFVFDFTVSNRNLDFDQLVIVKRPVQFIHNTTGDAIAGDSDDGIQIVADGAVRLLLFVRKWHVSV
jgi:hypothetical protein